MSTDREVQLQQVTLAEGHFCSGHEHLQVNREETALPWPGNKAERWEGWAADGCEENTSIDGIKF